MIKGAVVITRRLGSPGEQAKAQAPNYSGLTVVNISQALITGADLTLTYGRRYGLVGRNGLGKSTLLRTISRRQLIIPRHISILHVEQEVVGDETLALQSVLESFTLREDLLKEEKTINAKLAEG